MRDYKVIAFWEATYSQDFLSEYKVSHRLIYFIPLLLLLVIKLAVVRVGIKTRDLDIASKSESGTKQQY